MSHRKRCARGIVGKAQVVPVYIHLGELAAKVDILVGTVPVGALCPQPVGIVGERSHSLPPFTTRRKRKVFFT